MILFLILGLIIGAVAVLFMLQNITTITVAFFAWQLSGSLSVILLLTLVAGMLVAALILLPSFIRADWQIRVQKKRIKRLEDDAMVNAKPVASSVTEPAPVEGEVVDLNN